MKHLTKQGWKSLSQGLSSEESNRWIENFGKVVAGVAHEIRNPLNTLNLLLFSLRQELSNFKSFQKTFEYITQMEGVIQQIDSIIKNLLQANRPIVAHFQLVNLRQLFESMLQQFKLAFPRVSVTLSIDPKVTCTTDPDLLHHIFWNLWLNSFQANSKKIKISAIRENGKIVIKIQDDGGGIPRDILRGLFIPGNTTRPDTLGMGLYNCFRMIKAMLGTIRGENRRLGSQFILEVPKPS